jgi:phage shock protein E
MKTNQRIFYTVAFLTILAGAIFYSFQEKGFITVDAGEFYQLSTKENVLIIDVRTPEEFQGGYLPHAVNIDYYDNGFKEKLAGLDTSKTILIYCKSGNRSSKAATLMSGMGFKEIYELKGGIPVWISAGHQTVR